MNIRDSVLRGEEKIDLALRQLYESHGYLRYKMGKFEEYDLYAKNKDFLVSDNIITFTDGGRLKALKPDVTLSIVRSSRVEEGCVQKLYYNENVYRTVGSTRSFREIMQAGLECIGAVDDMCIAESLILAVESLRLISPECSLVVSHLGIISALLNRLGISGEIRGKTLRFLGEKNAHELAALTESMSDRSAAEALVKLTSLHGSADSVIPVLRSLEIPEELLSQLDALSAALTEAGAADSVRFDFSVVNDMRYYNGIVFKGYVSGVPESVLSGGQYDKLLARMDKAQKAIGFAVYLDAVSRIAAEAVQYDVDAVLLYDENCRPGAVYSASRSLSEKYGSVMTAKKLPEKLSCRVIAKLEGSEVTILEANA